MPDLELADGGVVACCDLCGKHDPHSHAWEEYGFPEPDQEGPVRYPTAEVADAVLDVLIAHNGIVAGEAGYVLTDIATESGYPYKCISKAVLYLESEGMVEVHRQDYPEARRANRVSAVVAL